MNLVEQGMQFLNPCFELDDHYNLMQHSPHRVHCPGSAEPLPWLPYALSSRVGETYIGLGNQIGELVDIGLLGFPRTAPSKSHKAFLTHFAFQSRQQTFQTPSKLSRI